MPTTSLTPDTVYLVAARQRVKSALCVIIRSLRQKAARLMKDSTLAIKRQTKSSKNTLEKNCVNHCALFLKLMDRNIPCNFLSLLEKWFSVSISCVKWGSSYSKFFQLLCGVRQGGVLSPFIFAIFVDSIVDRVKATGLGCYLNSVCVCQYFAICGRHCIICALSNSSSVPSRSL